MSSLIKLKDINKYYKVGKEKFHVLKSLNINIEEGDFVMIMGKSGSGKTTLLNCISTIDKVSSGHIYISGNDITKLNSKKISKFRREELGFIFQDFNLLDTLTIAENISLSLIINKKNENKIDEMVNDIAKRLDIEGILDKFPYEVSGGQKQRCACARALINKNLDATILMVTHDAFSASFCQRILFLKDGNIFTEILKGSKTRKEFFNEILDILTLLGGDVQDVK